MEFGALNWSIVIAYLLVNMLIGFLVSRRVQTAGDYNLGDRSAPWWAIGISVLATYVSALSFLGGPAWAYGDGMAALAIHLNYPLVIFAVARVTCGLIAVAYGHLRDHPIVYFLLYTKRATAWVRHRALQ